MEAKGDGAGAGVGCLIDSRIALVCCCIETKMAWLETRRGSMASRTALTVGDALAFFPSLSSLRRSARNSTLAWDDEIGRSSQLENYPLELKTRRN